MTQYVLALDAGGTTTKCWVVAGDGTVAGAGVGGPGNHILGSMEIVHASFRAATEAACARAQCPPDAIAAVVAGCAGIEATGETRGPMEELLAELFPDVAVHQAMGDMIVAFHGALPGGVGVIVNAGTGAVAYGQNMDGVGVQVDGWGHLFGDDGSGYAIGRAALRAAAQATDGRGKPTMLTDRLPAALGVDHMPGAAYAIYALEDPRETVAGLAPVVARAAVDGDDAAVEILAEAGTALARSAVTVLRHLGMDSTPARVATVGSLFLAGRAICDPFADALALDTPRATVVPPALPPVGGAAKLAWDAAGVHWGETEVARAQATQPT